MQDRTFATHIDLAEPPRWQLVELLNARLADTLDLVLACRPRDLHEEVDGRLVAQHERGVDRIWLVEAQAQG